MSLAFPLWRRILGPNSVLGASYPQKSWWQLSNSEESSPFRETNSSRNCSLGFATDYRFAGWTLRDVEMGYDRDSNGR
ncbi:phospholipase A [Shigella flexneri]